MKTFKINVLLISILLSSAVFSTNKFVVSRIFLANNDTIVSLMKYTKLHEMQEKIEVKINDSIISTLYPLDVKGFYTLAGKGDTVRFESNCGIKFGLADKIESNCYFMMKLNSGKIPLYYFSVSKLLTLGVSMETVQQPAYFAKYFDEWIMMEENNYISQIEKLLKPFLRNAKGTQLKSLKKLDSDLYYRVYKFNDVPEFFEKLNVLLK